MRLALVFVFAVIGVLSTAAAFAHPPVDITITWESQAKLLTAVLVHPVQDPATHNIAKVDVALNGKEILEHQISRQDDGQMQTVIYRIPDAKPGDTLSVEGYCNINGALTREIALK